MALALADVLPDFGIVHARSLSGLAGIEPVEREEAAAPVPPPAEPDPELIRAEISKAEDALVERLMQEHMLAMATQAESHAAEIDQLRAQLGAEAAAAFVARLDAVEAKLVAVTTGTVARILGGVLSDDIKSRGVAALTASLTAMLADREASRIVVRTPASLRETLGSALGVHAERAEIVEADGLDLSVAIDQTVMETRLAEWSSALAEVIA
ncbi:MAG TPA: hypothetical protein VNS02_00875 [Rhizobiaceae bacterium]|nr:hypothetical protein [Rhizobiaceae bacterium]